LALLWTGIKGTARSWDFVPEIILIQIVEDGSTVHITSFSALHITVNPKISVAFKFSPLQKVCV
jgi:hypothetical protein